MTCLDLGAVEVAGLILRRGRRTGWRAGRRGAEGHPDHCRRAPAAPRGTWPWRWGSEEPRAWEGALPGVPSALWPHLALAAALPTRAAAVAACAVPCTAWHSQSVLGLPCDGLAGVQGTLGLPRPRRGRPHLSLLRGT